jgi:hypothetical protein
LITKIRFEHRQLPMLFFEKKGGTLSPPAQSNINLKVY